MQKVGVVAGLVFLLDQASKYVVLGPLQLDVVRAIDVFPPYLNLRMAWNQGINFGLLSNQSDLVRWGLVALAVGISAFVWVWVRRETQQVPSHRSLMQFSAGLLIGGALGNALDRVIHGAVVDFLNMSCCGLDNPYAFNIADVSIFAGAIGLVLFSGHADTNRKTP